MLKHMDDYDPFTGKRSGFMVLMSSQSIERDQLIYSTILHEAVRGKSILILKG